MAPQKTPPELPPSPRQVGLSPEQPPTKKPRLQASESFSDQDGSQRSHTSSQNGNASGWIPPSVSELPDPSFHGSTTYHSPVPALVLSHPQQPVVLGVDEAGRGPVLGPMVYGIAYCLESYQEDLKKKYGFADSKTLKDDRRRELFHIIEQPAHELHKNVGWATRTMTARDISAAMLQGRGAAGGANLNEQAHNTTIQLIREVLAAGVNVTKIFVDTVGPPHTYQQKLQAIFPVAQVTVTKKADSIFPVVSTASVVAKVTRDVNLHWYASHLGQTRDAVVGSGYPSDPNTAAWLHSHVDPVFGWCPLVRFLWQTAKDSLKNHNGVPVVYETECDSDPGYGNVLAMMDKSSNYCVEVDFYGQSVVL